MKTQPGYANGPIYWTIENAAAAIQRQEEWTDHQGRSFFERLLQAAKLKELAVHHPDTGEVTTPREVNGFADLVTEKGVNAWLASKSAFVQWNTGYPKEAPLPPTPAVAKGETRPIEHFVLIPVTPKEIPELLRRLPPLESVRYKMECDGTGGEGATTSETLILVFETIIARQHIDRFTVDEAAFILARATGDTWDNWQQRIVAAANDGTLSSYRSRSVAPRLGQMRLIESSVIEVYADDLNQWVPSVAKRATYRFPPKGPAASVGVAPPAMLELTEVLSRDVETRAGLFEQGIQETLRFLVMVPGIGACRVPLLALEQFKAGADAVSVGDMVEHRHGAHSGPYTIKANCLHILKDDWDKYEAEFEAIVEKFVVMERAAHGDEQRWIAGRRLWRLSEAVAHVTSMHGFGVSRHDLEERLSSHDESELLMVASVTSGKRQAACNLCVFLDNYLYAEDFNAWLEAAGFREPYRLPLDTTTPSEQTKDATGQDEQEARAGQKESVLSQQNPEGQARLEDPRMRIQAEAAEYWIELLALNCNPSVHGISNRMATWCNENEVRTKSGVNPSAGHIRNTILNGKNWTPPQMTREKAKAHVAARKQVAQPAQVSQRPVAQPAQVTKKG